jgi:secondary thiamine-phosphate synthase enzyme
MVYSSQVEIQTKGNSDMLDLTDQVQKIITNSGIREGIVSLFTPSSTSALTTIEYEDGALNDLRRALDQIAPQAAEYKHNLRWGDGNGHSHLRAALIGPSLTIPVNNHRMILGVWQQVLFIDFDVRPRQRNIVVQILGNGV